MKITAIILFFITLSITKAQWVTQNSGTTANLYDIEFLNRNTGWALGDGGTVIKTTNGGVNWINSPNPATGRPLSSIHIVDSNTIYFVGWFETVVKTTNGGANWTMIRAAPVGQGESYEGLFFVNENTGWVVGTGQRLLRTSNGGKTFEEIPILVGFMKDLFFRNINEGIVCGDGLILEKTTNSGYNWVHCNLNQGSFYPYIWKLSFINDQTGWVPLGNRKVFKTTNFGTSWDSVGNVEVAFPSWGLYCIDFANINTGWAGGENGKFFKSTNGGAEWKRENTGTSLRFFASIYAYSDSIVWTCGGVGTIMHTTTGGETLVGVESETTEFPKDYILKQNYPNPFNPSTTIEYELKQRGFVRLSVYDLSGKEIEQLVNENKPVGNYKAKFTGNSLPSGVYFYRLEINNFVETKRMILVK